jgi:uncharacterized membrane protein YfcA
MAVASAMVSYIAAGSVGMLMYARKNSIEWSSTAVLLVAAAPAAFAGSYFLQYMSDIAVKLVLYTREFGVCRLPPLTLMLRPAVIHARMILLACA